MQAWVAHSCCAAILSHAHLCRCPARPPAAPQADQWVASFPSRCMLLTESLHKINPFALCTPSLVPCPPKPISFRTPALHIHLLHPPGGPVGCVLPQPLRDVGGCRRVDAVCHHSPVAPGTGEGPMKGVATAACLCTNGAFGVSDGICGYLHRWEVCDCVTSHAGQWV